MTRKIKLLSVALVATMLAGNVATAQSDSAAIVPVEKETTTATESTTATPETTTSTSGKRGEGEGYTDDVVRDKDNNAKWRSGQSKFPSKPRSMWELGIHGGYLQYAGDVNSQPGYAVGFHLRKALGYVFSLRFNVFGGRAYGLNYLPSLHGVGLNRNLGVGTKLLPTAEGSGIANAPVDGSARGYGWDIKSATPGGTLYQKTGTGLPYYYNYRSEYLEASVQGIITLNNLKFHKERTKWDLFLIAGVGFNSYGTRHDALDKNGNLYDQRRFSEILAKEGESKATYDKIREEIKGSLDGTYETVGEEWGALYDFGSEGKLSEQGRGGRTFKINPIANAGVGIGYRLSKRVSISLEHQTTFNDDDLLDGYRWAEQGDFTQNKDFPHYTNLRLNFNIGSFKKSVEPLWWLNALDASYADLAKQKGKPGLDDAFKDTDGDGVPDKLDREPNTPSDCPVDTRGVSMDSDGDGVKDCDDKEPFTYPGIPVDPNGVGTKGISNIDCSSCATNSEWFLPMVHFNSDSYCIKPEFQPQLKHVANIMTKNSKLCVAIEGYTDDNRSDADYNSGLSYNRANAIKDYLVKNYSIDASRLKVKIKSNDAVVKTGGGTSAAQYMNRRVEMRIVPCTEASEEAPANASSAGNATNCDQGPMGAMPIPAPGNPTDTRLIRDNGGSRPERKGSRRTNPGIIKR